ncbi:MAG: hypothetical protein E6I75_27255, partial [Chloroflexi bacterium]
MQFPKQIVHQSRDQARVLGQPRKTRLQQQAIAALQLGQAGVTQPVRHAAQRVEQVTQLPGHAVAARTQPQVTDRSLHPLRLQQRLAGLAQNEMLLFRVGTAQQVDDAACFQRRQRLAPYRGQDRCLVAHGQPRQLPRQARRQQAQSQF